MRVRSFMRQGFELVPVEVELVLAAGLPQIHILGLPDMALRESALRIRAAIRKQGFRLPKAQQILVHLKPNHLRKTSRGLDLAVAAALLWETKQIPPPPAGEEPVLYGELSLRGEVETPDDIREINPVAADTVYTGSTCADIALRTKRLIDLRSLLLPAQIPLVPASSESCVRRPKPPVEWFLTEAARVAEIIAAGEHSSLVIGSQGTGKSTLATAVLSWLEEPRGEGEFGAKRLADPPKKPGEPRFVWRPFSRPHHSITPLAMIGGGQQIWTGEITRAHTGLLVMDELLKFAPEIQDSLREPLEHGEIVLSRGGRTRSHPARVILVATTNLCDCGRFVPRPVKNDPCRCPSRVRRRVLQKLSGPFVDRFHIIAFSDDWRVEGGTVATGEIQERVRRAAVFRRSVRGQIDANATAKLGPIEVSLHEDASRLLKMDAAMHSLRRREAIIRVARTCADLREADQIEVRDLNESLHFSLRSHRLLDEWRG